MNVTIIIYAIVAFLAVTLVLVALLLFAKARLTSSGAVKVNINDGDKVLEVESGSTLLNTLSEQGIFLPSACGGKGACGQCKCQVVSGGGEILPTERGFFNRREINEGWRLGCQVKVKEDILDDITAQLEQASLSMDEAAQQSVLEDTKPLVTNQHRRTASAGTVSDAEVRSISNSSRSSITSSTSSMDSLDIDKVARPQELDLTHQGQPVTEVSG